MAYGKYAKKTWGKKPYKRYPKKNYAKKKYVAKKKKYMRSSTKIGNYLMNNTCYVKLKAFATQTITGTSENVFAFN